MIENRCLAPCESALEWCIFHDGGDVKAELQCSEEHHTVLVVYAESIAAAMSGDERFILGPREES